MMVVTEHKEKINHFPVIMKIFTAYTVQTSIQRFVQVRDYIEQRVLALGVYIVEQNATVRQAAKMFGVSKSTVHMAVTIWNG